jgi:ribose 5-phosphate isomerase B
LKIAAGWDHHGRAYRQAIKDILEDLGHEMIDLGAPSDDSSDYPDFAFRVGEAVASKQADRGLLVCGSGIGMAIAANKVQGIRAGLAYDVQTARLSRAHNDTNVLCIAEWTARDEALLRKLIDIWLTTPFEQGGRHERRVGKIVRYERDRDKPA